MPIMILKRKRKRKMPTIIPTILLNSSHLLFKLKIHEEEGNIFVKIIMQNKFKF